MFGQLGLKMALKSLTQAYTLKATSTETLTCYNMMSKWKAEA